MAPVSRIIIAAATALLTAGRVMPATAEVFQIISAGQDDQLIVDCPQSPAGRALSWVATNCRLATASNAPVSKVVVRGWNPDAKEAIIGRADAGDPYRPVIIGTVPNPNTPPPR